MFLKNKEKKLLRALILLENFSAIPEQKLLYKAAGFIGLSSFQKPLNSLSEKNIISINNEKISLNRNCLDYLRYLEKIHENEQDLYGLFFANHKQLRNVFLSYLAAGSCSGFLQSELFKNTGENPVEYQQEISNIIKNVFIKELESAGKDNSVYKIVYYTFLYHLAGISDIDTGILAKQVGIKRKSLYDPLEKLDFVGLISREQLTSIRLEQDFSLDKTKSILIKADFSYQNLASDVEKCFTDKDFVTMCRAKYQDRQNPGRTQQMSSEEIKRLFLQDLNSRLGESAQTPIPTQDRFLASRAEKRKSEDTTSESANKRLRSTTNSSSGNFFDNCAARFLVFGQGMEKTTSSSSITNNPNWLWKQDLPPEGSFTYTQISEDGRIQNVQAVEPNQPTDDEEKYTPN